MMMEDQDFYEERASFFPKIFTPLDVTEEIPFGFNAISLTLDGRMKSDMNWKEQHKAAINYAEKGFKLFWQMDLGLFSKLDYPLADETQFQAFILSLHHFRDSLWKEFKEQTVGLSLYSGSGDFSHGYPWDEQQREAYQKWLKKHEMEDLSSAKRLFCCEASAEYLGLLAQSMPDSLPLFALLNVKCLETPLEIARVTSKERFERINLMIEGQDNPIPLFAWQTGKAIQGFIGREPLSLIEQEVSIALCLPDVGMVNSVYYEGMEKILHEFHIQNIPYRIIPETYLITEWDGLDYLIYSQNGLSPQGKRKLQGFCAAGGAVISTEEFEISRIDELLLR